MGKRKASTNKIGGKRKLVKKQTPRKEILNGIEPIMDPEIVYTVANRFQVYITPEPEPNIIESSPIIQDKKQNNTLLNGLFTPIIDNAPESNLEKIQ